MKNLSFYYFLIILFLQLTSCNNEEKIDPTPPAVEEIKLRKISDTKLLPLESKGFGGNAFLGSITDYRVFFNDLEVSVHKLTTDSIYVLVPLEIEVGEKAVKLLYKTEEYEFGKVEIVDWRKALPGNVSYFEGDDPNMPYIIKDDSSNSVIPYFNEAGVMDKIYIQDYTGRLSILELNEQGLPSLLYNEDNSIVFDGYDLEKSTVNIARFDGGDLDNATYQFGVPMDDTQLQALLDMAKGQRLPNGRIRGDVGTVFNYISTVFGITGCIIATGIVVSNPVTIAAVGTLVIPCGSAAYDAWKILNPDIDNKQASLIQTVYGINSAAADCAIVNPKNPYDVYKAVYGCYSLGVEGVKQLDGGLQENLTALEDGLVNLRKVINSGFGDIKITLEWDTDVDLDLWTIDPNGSKIYFGEETSPSGGQLDLDDTNGFGPENIFWEMGEAPFGSYKVQVHYFGEGDGEDNVYPLTTYKVTVWNFGVPKVFTGTLNYDQVASVVTFTAGEGFPSSPGGRLSLDVVKADRSNLKPKLKP